MYSDIDYLLNYYNLPNLLINPDKSPTTKYSMSLEISMDKPNVVCLFLEGPGWFGSQFGISLLEFLNHTIEFDKFNRKII